MSADVKEFFGKDITGAIKEACDTLGVAQEMLNIEVVETGSKGIFGLISKKAHIRVTVQKEQKEPEAEPPPTEAQPQQVKDGPAKAEKKSRDHAQPPPPESEAPAKPSGRHLDAEDNDTEDDDDDNGRAPIDLSDETMAVIREQLSRLLELMHCPSTVTVQDEGGIAECKVSADHEAVLTGQEGKVLDSLQYLLRKIVSRKLPGRVQITIDVGNYRQRRHEQLEKQALEYAAMVKENGKTQVIPSLNPSERRIVHVALQDDPTIRSRSIGEGLFKKVLIYKPGKGRKPNRGKKRGGRSRRKSANGPKSTK